MTRIRPIPNLRFLLPALLACLALAGCATGPGYGTGGQGAYPGSYPGGGYDPGGYGQGGYGSQPVSQRIIATVESVDARSGRLLLAVQDSRNYSQSRIEVYYDNRTRLSYQGREYPMAGLERGDQIAVDAVQSNGRTWATRVEVVRNVRDSGGYRY